MMQNWLIPPTRAPIAMDRIGCIPHRGMIGDKKIPARMQQMLNAEEAMAGMKKDPQAFRIPIPTEASATHKRKGDMI